MLPPTTTSSYKNVIEGLVYEEIEKQLRSYSHRIRPYINKVEVATFALNRLPALYASTEKGKQHQLKEAQKHRSEIAIAVQRGLAAVVRDPIRKSKPLISETQVQYFKAEQTLKELQEFLQQRNLMSDMVLSWGNLVREIKRAFRRVSAGENIQTTESHITYGNSEIHSSVTKARRTENRYIRDSYRDDGDITELNCQFHPSPSNTPKKRYDIWEA